MKSIPIAGYCRQMAAWFFCAVLLLNTIYVHASPASSQRKMLGFESTTAEKVILHLEAAFSVKFTYNPSLSNLQKKITLVKKERTLDETLDEVAEKAMLKFVKVGNLIGVQAAQVYKASYMAAYMPAFTVKGIVVDDKQSPVVGASVVNKRTNSGTATDEKGAFSISAEKGDVLAVSYVGFSTQEITINEDKLYSVILQADVSAVNEVVVTALGIKKEKARLGYAVQEVKGENLVKAPEPNMINSLTGRVAGLQVYNSTDLFQNPSIYLRGRQPLIVIDGVPDQSADFWKINSNDVENISVLKGATASALYGSIGQNGAIMITTKRGKGKDLVVDFNSSTMFQPSFIRIPDVQTQYGNGYKGQYAFVDGSGGGTEGAGWIWGPKLDQRDANTPSGYWETTQYDSPIDPNTGERVPTAFLSRGKDNVKNFFRTGIVSSNSISISKGNEKGSFRTSASHIYQLGIVPNTQLNNSSFSVAGNYNLTEKLNVDARLTYNRQYTPNFPETGYGPTNYLYNLVLWTGPDVDVKTLRNYWAPGQEGIQQYHYNNSWYNNPYFQAYEYLRSYYKDNTFGSLTLSYKINNDFSAKFRTGANIYGLNRDIKEPKSYVGYSNKSLGNYYVTDESYFDIVNDLMLEYEHQFTGNFKLHALAGGSNYYRNFKGRYSNTDGLTIPGFYNLANSINPTKSTNNFEERRTASLYGYVDLEFLNSIYVSATARQDKISTLPIANNTYFYPSYSASVVISQLARLPKVISYLKARASWSTVSSGTLLDDDYTYSYIPAYNNGTIWNGTPSLVYGPEQISSDLKPQTSHSWEGGLEIRLFNSRLSFDVTYFQTRDANNISKIPVSNTSGYSSFLVNGHIFQRRGLEIIASGTPVKSANFRWDVTANFSTYRRYLKEIYNNEERLDNLRVGDNTDKIFDWTYATDPSGNIIYENNGFPLWNSFVSYRGNSDPKWTYGLENSFNYKNYSLKILVDGRIGGLMYSTTNQKMWWGGTHPGTVNQFRDDANAGNATYVGQGVVVVSGEVQYDANGNITSDTRKFAPNTTAVNYIDYMVNTSNAAYVNYNYYSQTFLKLREVTFSWQLPAAWLSNSFFKSASFGLVGRNLLLFSKLPNVDPDPRSDNLQTPATRNIGFNVNLKF
ncbi:SusC/RagA family TonB-linked outer membrane protein [Foetidibacter luteolus]|uniref:SusC/RagA family TonB-linked outer membrane protein n=1 Tax=Foetidibacter luteolus TaxID=2608880 RepID=UPI00129A3690|nr:SusC/RagA family TonB-linked outer membrane protein [Foetidibacter luteolus]